MEFWKEDKREKYKIKQEISFDWVNDGRPETEVSPLNAPEAQKEGGRETVVKYEEVNALPPPPRCAFRDGVSECLPRPHEAAAGAQGSGKGATPSLWPPSLDHAAVFTRHLLDL